MFWLGCSSSILYLVSWCVQVIMRGLVQCTWLPDPVFQQGKTPQGIPFLLSSAIELCSLPGRVVAGVGAGSWR